MMFCVFFIATALTGILGNPNFQTCELTMKSHGLTDRFAGAASHGIHSLTLEDIQYYFKPNATENNRIPTLNYDLLSPNVILPNAPLYGYDTSFETIGMRYVDQVLSHMDNKNWYLTNYNALEQLIHTFHMEATWLKAQKHYVTLEESGKNDARYVDVCKCVNDVDNNGVMKMLNFFALKIRYPGFSEGKRAKDAGGYTKNAFAFPNEKRGYPAVKDKVKKVAAFQFSSNLADNFRRANGVLVDGDPGLRKLDSQKMWKVWKNRIKGIMVDQDYYEMAMFLYCRLNY